MKKTRTPGLVAALFAIAMMSGPVAAKLPAPSDEAKAKAEETAAKAAHAGKVGAFQLCQSMDRVAKVYFEQAKRDGKETKPAAATAPCAEPGPFVYTPPAVAAPPLEAAGAHSPAKTATAPPSTLTPSAAQAPAKK